VSELRRIYLGLGGNLGDRIANLRGALDALIAGDIAIDSVSALYETPPWGVMDQPSFVNAAASGLTELSARELLALAKQIEVDAGRDFEAPRWTARPIDIDVLLIESETVDSPDFVVPHQLMQERTFVLVPLRDIASGVVHPSLGQTVEELLNALPQADRDGVVEIEGANWYEFPTVR
jgi:2-amino-4-hydroxy-6-hydroxymethyldihydropteridine diphosphokinase